MSTVTPTEEIQNKSNGNVKDGESILPHRSRLYNNLVPVYQGLWPAVAKKNMRAAISALNIPTQHEVLEVGVGTGLSLDSYPRDIRLTGVDLSEAMLEEAQQLIASRDWKHINVMPMNAESLTFDDDRFDVVTSFHTVSVVSDADAMMSEIVRVCRPGGRVLLVNHFRSDNPLIAKVVDRAGTVTKRLGWRTDLELESVVGGHPIRVDRAYKLTPLSIFTILEATVVK